MADFPRTVYPFEVTSLETPGPLISKAQSGKVNTRSTQQIGRTWTEHFLLNVRTLTHRSLLAYVDNAWRNGTIFDITHLDHLTPLGAIGGTPLVKGAGQTGANLLVDGATINVPNWLRAGDIISVNGLTMIYEVTADCSSNGSGEVTIPINPIIFTGGSPADNAAVTVTGVKLKAVILEPPSFPTTSASSADWGELVLKFSEALG